MVITLDLLSAAAAIIVFIGILAYKYWKKEKIALSDMVLVILAAGMLPLSFSMALYQFFPSLIVIEKLGLQITITGLVLIYVYVKTIIEKGKNSS